MITADPAKKGPQSAPIKDIQASAKTLAALSTPAKATAPTSDPWATEDPWSTPTKFARPTQGHQVTKHDLAAIEQRVDQKVRQMLNKADHDDVPMAGDDDRVLSLEQRMSKMEQSMHEQQSMIAAHHAETQAQINQVKTQVDTQNATVNQLLDHRFTEQLNEIERLLAKRPKPAE